MKYIMTTRALSCIRNSRIKYNLRCRERYRLPLVPICKLCNEEIKEGDEVTGRSYPRKYIYHTSCLENSRI